MFAGDSVFVGTEIARKNVASARVASKLGAGLEKTYRAGRSHIRYRGLSAYEPVWPVAICPRNGPPKPMIWNIFKIAAKFLGVIEAADEATAIKWGAGTWATD
jgi:hypothetical protein